MRDLRTAVAPAGERISDLRLRGVKSQTPLLCSTFSYSSSLSAPGRSGRCVGGEPTYLRCLDAHAHLGNLVYDRRPEDAIRHYEVGVRIGELSLGDDFDGVLLWGHIYNRPFLRSMHGYGLCLWRLGRFDEAERVFDRMLWLNPSDNQGVRFLNEDVRARRSWEEPRYK